MDATNISDILGLNCPPDSSRRPPSPPPLPPSVPIQVTQKISKAPALPPKLEVIAAKLSGLDGYKAAADKAMLQTLTNFRPTFFFFYGTLMDPEVLQQILSLDELPRIEKATITKFKIKMWGIYPALVGACDGVVTGTIWQVANVDQFIRLARYETSAYTPCEVEIMRQDGEIEHGKSFRWAGDPNSSDLEEGSFSLDLYQVHFKPALFQGSG